jgi:lipopolysaccharide export system ATP-binding protein
MVELSTANLTKIFNHVTVVNNLNLHFASGRITALLGRNGAGKTTTFLMLSGILRPDHGDVIYAGQRINDVPSHRRADLGLIYMPQQHSIFTKTTVYDNLFLTAQLTMDNAAARQRVAGLLEEYGLGEVRASHAYQLSGGEKRRLEIARSMIKNPTFLFLDEPFTGIDPITIIEIQKIVTRLKEKGIGVIITDHNVKDTFYISDEAYIIHKGNILSHGTPDKIVAEPNTRDLFLGQDFTWEKETAVAPKPAPKKSKNKSPG